MCSALCPAGCPASRSAVPGAPPGEIYAERGWLARAQFPCLHHLTINGSVYTTGVRGALM